MSKAKETFRVFVVRKRWWTAAACLCLAALIFGVVNHPAVVGASAAARQLPIYCVQRDQKLVSISFDAAWGNAILRYALPLCLFADRREPEGHKSGPSGSY